jgi:hypothetical protein
MIRFNSTLMRKRLGQTMQLIKDCEDNAKSQKEEDKNPRDDS